MRMVMMITVAVHSQQIIVTTPILPFDHRQLSDILSGVSTFQRFHTITPWVAGEVSSNLTASILFVGSHLQFAV